MLFQFCVFHLTFALINANLNVVSQENVPSAPLPFNGAAVDEVVVESSLYIKPKPIVNMRKIRSILHDSLLVREKVKRSPQPMRYPPFGIDQPQYGQSQAASNAAAQSHYQNPSGFGTSAANAQAQAFHAQGAAGSFGASSAGTVTQAQNANRFAAQNSLGASQSQTFTLPSGQTINFASTNSLANGPLGNTANSRGGAVSVSQG